MERVVEARRPVQSQAEGLSSTAKTFFGLNIFQVVAIGGIQGAMIACGNFEDVQNGGLGPGRRIYMALFLWAVLYSCFLCLFAVKQQNFLEILAFVLQNYGYISYSGIQVYHISFKNYENQKLKRQTVLVYLTVIDSIGLFIVNIIFTWLAIKLYGEYGWKIYKRVRFNIRLRAAFHVYETVLMLLKMQFLFITMFSICLNQTIHHGDLRSFSHVASLVSIPVCLVFSIMGVIGIRRENKPASYFFIFGVFAAILYFIYKIVSVATRECTGCEALKNTKRDIPGEVELHLLYLASVNLLLLGGLLVASIKAIRNFDIGLAEYFKSGVSSKLTVLSLSRNILTSIVTSSAEDNGIGMDLESPRPSVSNEPRPSIFQYLPKFMSSVGNNTADETDQAKCLSLPAQLHRGEKKVKHIGSSAKSRISQIFWENDFAAFSSQRSSMSSRRYSTSRCCSCCPWLKSRRASISAYVIPHNAEPVHNRISVTENCSLFKDGTTSNICQIRYRKRSRSIGGAVINDRNLKVRPRPRRVNSLPNESSFQQEFATQNCNSMRYETARTNSSSENCWRTSFKRRRSSCTISPSTKHKVPSIRLVSYENNDGYSENDEVEPCALGSPAEPDIDVFSTDVVTTGIVRRSLRRTKSSVPSLSNIKTEASLTITEQSGLERGDEQAPSGNSIVAKKRKMGNINQPLIAIRKCSSDWELSKQTKTNCRVSFKH